MIRIQIANRRDDGWWWRLPLVTVIWLAIALPLIAGLLVVITLRGWARDLPDVPDLRAWRANAPQTSVILAADGSRLDEQPFRDGAVIGHRTLGSLDQLPPHLIQAVLAAEDVRFFSHGGADYTAIARAALANYRAEHVTQGASTITQQLARNLLPVEIGTERSARRKFREVLMARNIERRWTKREILGTYLDFVFLGQGAYGVVAASREYFDREVTEIDLPQAALLAGLIQAPTRLNPFLHPEQAKQRRDEVLARMARAHVIDERARAAAAATPLALHPHQLPYGSRVPWYTEQVRRLIAAALPTELARGSLTVETAALPALGDTLQREVAAHSERWGRAQTAALIWDHRTGYVEALIGGTTWDPDRFDRMLLACRQPGSAWKPVVYGAALEAGAITPGTALRDAPVSEYDEVTGVHWKPRSGERFRGVVLAQDAFAASLNAPAIDVLDRVGGEAVIKLARRLGISAPLENVRPLALGASCVKPIELARVYAVIARGGWAIAPRFAVRVRRGDEVLFDAAPPEDPWLDTARRFDRLALTAAADPAERISAEGGRLLDAPTAFQLADLMAAVVARGTASSARQLGRPAAGKTGTTNDNTDAWFIGFTGRVLGVVWTGFDDPTRKLGNDGDGAHAALPLWMQAIREAEGDRAPAPVPGPPPPELERVSIDRETGLRSAPGAPGLEVWFRAGTAPTEVSGHPGGADGPTDFGRSSSEF